MRTTSTDQHLVPDPGRRSTLPRLLPVAWLTLSATWAAVIVVTDQPPAWPLAIWIAATLGPLIASRARGPSGPSAR